MTRVFVLIFIFVFGASGAFAQSRHAGPPKKKRAEPPKEEAKDDAGEKPQEDEAQANDDKPVPGEEVIVRAVIRSKPNPDYPRGARRYGVQGVVKLRIILGSDGRVRDKMEVLEGLPYGITEEAMKAALRIEFEPARRDGRPVSQYVTVIYHFRLH